MALAAPRHGSPLLYSPVKPPLDKIKQQGVKRPHIMGALGRSSEVMIAHYTAAMELDSEAIEEFKRIDPFGGR